MGGRHGAAHRLAQLNAGLHHVSDDPQILGSPSLQEQALEGPFGVVERLQQRNHSRCERSVRDEEGEDLTVINAQHRDVETVVDLADVGEWRREAVVEAATAHDGGSAVECLWCECGARWLREGRSPQLCCDNRG